MGRDSGDDWAGGIPFSYPRLGEVAIVFQAFRYRSWDTGVSESEQSERGYDTITIKVVRGAPWTEREERMVVLVG